MSETRRLLDLFCGAGAVRGGGVVATNEAEEAAMEAARERGRAAGAAAVEKALREAILEIDRNAVALGQDDQGWAAIGYFVSIGALHRALGVVGHPAAKDAGFVELEHYVDRKTAEALATVIRRHRKGPPHGESGIPRCHHDDETWPCSTLLNLRFDVETAIAGSDMGGSEPEATEREEGEGT